MALLSRLITALFAGGAIRRAEFDGRALVFRPAPDGDTGDVLVIPKAATDL